MSKQLSNSERFDRALITLVCVLLMACVVLLVWPQASMAEEAAMISPTTGLETDTPYRPVLVSISFVKEARPSWNLSEADIVYESIFWGPVHTRLLALYNDNYPDKVGRVRGIRQYNAELQQAWDAAILHFGGQDSPGTSIYDFFAQHLEEKGLSIDGVRQSTLTHGIFLRDQAYISPHNAYVDVNAAVGSRWPTDPETGEAYESRPPAMVFSDTPTLGSEEAHTIDLLYDEDVYHVTYQYKEGSGQYVRWQSGKPQLDGITGKRIACANVIVQCHDQYFAEHEPSRPVIHTTGAGPMTAYIEGTRVEGIWIRPRMEDPIQYYDLDGNVIEFARGKTFVQMVPPHMYHYEGSAEDVYSNELWYWTPPVEAQAES